MRRHHIQDCPSPDQPSDILWASSRRWRSISHGKPDHTDAVTPTRDPFTMDINNNIQEVSYQSYEHEVHGRSELMAGWCHVTILDQVL